MSVLLWILVLSFAALLVTTIVCYAIVEIYAYKRVFKSKKEIPENEYALILGTSPVLKNGKPNRYFVRRMNAAADLFHSGKVRHLILSGDKHEGYDEPSSMQKALTLLGVPDEVCILDGKGFDTIDSIMNAKKLLGAQSITIISQDFHCERAVLLAGCLGIKAVAYEAVDVETFWKSKTKHREILARVKVFKDFLFLKLRKTV